jgi:hypothetical protein
MCACTSCCSLWAYCLSCNCQQGEREQRETCEIHERLNWEEIACQITDGVNGGCPVEIPLALLMLFELSEELSAAYVAIIVRYRFVLL